MLAHGTHPHLKSRFCQHVFSEQHCHNSTFSNSTHVPSHFKWKTLWSSLLPICPWSLTEASGSSCYGKLQPQQLSGSLGVLFVQVLAFSAGLCQLTETAQCVAPGFLPFGSLLNFFLKTFSASAENPGNLIQPWACLLPVPGIRDARQQQTQHINRGDRALASVMGSAAKSCRSIIHAHMCECTM